MTAPEPSLVREVVAFFRTARPWWLVAFLVTFVLALVLALGDFAPLRSLAYSVH